MPLWLSLQYRHYYTHYISNYTILLILLRHPGASPGEKLWMDTHDERKTRNHNRQIPRSKGQPSPEAVNLSAFGCQKEAANLPHSRYSGNSPDPRSLWYISQKLKESSLPFSEMATLITYRSDLGVKLQTWPSPISVSPFKNTRFASISKTIFGKSGVDMSTCLVHPVATPLSWSRIPLPQPVSNSLSCTIQTSTSPAFGSPAEDASVSAVFSAPSDNTDTVR